MDPHYWLLIHLPVRQRARAVDLRRHAHVPAAAGWLHAHHAPKAQEHGRQRRRCWHLARRGRRHLARRLGRVPLGEGPVPARCRLGSRSVPARSSPIRCRPGSRSVQARRSSLTQCRPGAGPARFPCNALLIINQSPKLRWHPNNASIAGIPPPPRTFRVHPFASLVQFLQKGDRPCITTEAILEPILLLLAKQIALAADGDSLARFRDSAGRMCILSV